MADGQIETTKSNSGEFDIDQLELARSIIETLLDHTRIVSDLIAVMAQALDEDTTKALTQTAQWEAYLESRRRMGRAREDIDKFVQTMKDLGSKQ